MSLSDLLELAGAIILSARRWLGRRSTIVGVPPSAVPSFAKSLPAGGVASGPLRGAGSEELGDNAGLRGVPPGDGEDDDLPGRASDVCAVTVSDGSCDRAVLS